jgi:hypothetical protein
MDTTFYNRFDRMATRVAFFILSDESPELFSKAFIDARLKAKKYKYKLEEEVQNSLKNSLINDLKSRGHEGISVEISLGQYRGSRFVTSAKIRVLSNDIGQARLLEKYLKKYHSRFNLKLYDAETKVAEYNIR